MFLSSKPYLPIFGLDHLKALRTKREKLLAESIARRATSRSKTSKTKTPKAATAPKFASPLLEQLFSGLSPEMKDYLTKK